MQREALVAGYPEEVEAATKTFFDTLREKDKRRYAAVEAAKFGKGGLAYVSRLLGIDPSTIRQGQADLDRLPPGEDPGRDGQFGRIAELRQQFLGAGDPVLSIDTKRRELIGNFYRPGVLLTRQAVR